MKLMIILASLITSSLAMATDYRCKVEGKNQEIILIKVQDLKIPERLANVDSRAEYMLLVRTVKPQGLGFPKLGIAMRYRNDFSFNSYGDGESVRVYTDKSEGNFFQHGIMNRLVDCK